MASPIIERFSKFVIKTPEKTALIFRDQSLSYNELGEQVNRLSHSLIQGGVQQGDHIGVVLPNGIEFVLVMLAAANIGAAIVPHNTSLNAKTLIHAFNDTKVCHYILWHSIINELQNETTCNNDGALWISVGKNKSQTLYFNDLLSVTCDKTLGCYKVNQDQDFIYTMTSGSTGAPKPIVLSQICKVKRADSAIRLYGITSADITLAATPLYHSLAERLVLLPLISGGTVSIMAGFSPEQWFTTIENDHISFTIAVSSQLKTINDQLTNSTYNLRSLRCLVSSSERLPLLLKQNLIKQFKCEFHECYGASEVAIISNLDQTHGDNKLSSVGKSINDVSIVILDDGGNKLPTGTIGEIACKTPMLFSGYHQREAQTKASMVDNYFLTGDLGKLDNDDFLYFCGRKKEIIITGGINVYPKDIEEILLRHPEIDEAAVIPLPDDSLGEIITAVIVSNRAINKRELQRLCAKELADFQQPRKYIFLDNLPKNALGKVMKSTLVSNLSPSVENVS
jgi:long-chain acyl-CoA synthetase